MSRRHATALGGVGTGGGSDALDADVLVLGGGPAGTWAALAAATTGARVVLADKGFVGTSGAAAAGGNNLWYVPDEGDRRERAVRAREERGAHLTDRTWLRRLVAETWDRVGDLEAWGYPYPTDAAGRLRRSSLQGPEYMRLMRRQVLRAGVTVLDQSPAQRLVQDADGVVVGATGVHRQRGNAPWTVRAGAVVLATGGCAFLSGALGCNPDTGDGHLMAAELGAELSGMEFSSVYGMAPAFGAQTKGRMYQFATYYDGDRNPVDAAGFSGREVVARTLAAGSPVYARLDLAPPALREALRWSQPNFFLPYDKAGIDVFTDLFEVRLVLEGTVRGTGGLAVVGDGCETTVPGLYAAGDVASRELVTGAVSGGGSHNGAWAISSGTWAGTAAASFARRRGPAPRATTVPDEGRAGTGGSSSGRGTTVPREVIRDVQAEVIPLERNLFRTEHGLRGSLARLDVLWADAVPDLDASAEPVKAREAAAMVAHARWMYRAALARPESRVIHRRDDHPDLDERLTHRIRVGGLDEVWTRPEVPVREEERAS
ncbi:L-aspartate oxidase [Luteimicrobium xylanilyticum]|uniref:L-aspartate oxidase n=1 Tax=Luteimicrobium xylanilyticum TaxID=1133546 RepID=A0A5P9QES7_9MICO|nr:FAD-binding protein [Luteimicrobium xylanilyticum]QFU99988.1 L-aspartate oxidase [Luteimicrobium xylanilyticum]